MTQERKQVLDMLAQGKISVQDAERLLDKLANSGAGAAEADSGAPSTDAAWNCCGTGATKTKLRFLRVQVDDSDGDKVNIRIPLSLVRAGIKLKAVMPEQARQHLLSKGIDISHLNGLEGEDLLDALRELNVDVDGSDGEKVRIFCE